jgi:hypothetical protein
MKHVNHGTNVRIDLIINLTRRLTLITVHIISTIYINSTPVKVTQGMKFGTVSTEAHFSC